MAADLILACGMCVVAGWGALAAAAQYVKYRNARRRAEAGAAAGDGASAAVPPDRAPAPQPA